MQSLGLYQIFLWLYVFDVRAYLTGLEVIKLEFILRLKIKRNDWLFADTCPQAASHYALFWVWTCTQVLWPRGQL